MAEKTSSESSRWLVILTVVIVVVFTLIFLLEFFVASQSDGRSAAQTLTEETYMTEVNALLAGADVENGAALIETYECHVCHIDGAGQVAPGFDGLAARAVDRRPPLTAAAYLYESIAFPHVYVVDGYPNSMLRNYLDRLSEDELGDILAYLLETNEP